jgi:ABC-type nitrate/sulfonate/bicarbonate transport system ATPase subunit
MESISTSRRASLWHWWGHLVQGKSTLLNLIGGLDTAQ